MMKSNNSKSYRCAAVVALAVLLVSFVGPGYCDEQGTALLLEMSPVEGGSVNVAPGVHLYGKDSEVKLVAVPKPGYQFVYWMGNVSESTASSTSVYLDSPKIVIAVFERSKFDFVNVEEPMDISNGGGGMHPSRSDNYAGIEQATGGQRRPSFRSPTPKTNQDVPVPEDTGDVPTPVPEPTTITLLFSGLFMLVNRRRTIKSTPEMTL